MKPIFGVVVQPGTTTDQKKGGWRTYRPSFRQEDCIGCQTCRQSCPEGAVYMIEKKRFASDTDACKGCGICARMCPVQDVEMVLEVSSK